MVSEMLAQTAQIKIPVNAAKEVIPGNVVLKIEGVEKAFLAIRLKPHHIKALHSFDMQNITISNIKL
jgi:hypothetical protein